MQAAETAMWRVTSDGLDDLAVALATMDAAVEAIRRAVNVESDGSDCAIPRRHSRSGGLAPPLLQCIRQSIRFLDEI